VSTSGVESFVTPNQASPHNHTKNKFGWLQMFKGTDQESTATDQKEATTTTTKNDFEVQTRNPLRLLVLKLGLTEPRMMSPFNYGKYDGVFNCAYCGQTLFDSSAKYESGSGWPSFWRSASEDSIDYQMEFGGRLECRCKRCSSHLGHVFLDGPQPDSVESKVLEQAPASDPRGKTGKYLPRFCINGASMTFDSREETD